MKGFKPISLEDQVILEPILQKYQSESSEYTFAYIYMWRHDYGFSYAIHNNYLVIISESGYDIPFALCPIPIDTVYETNSFSEIVHWLKAEFKENNYQFVFARVHEPLLQWFYNITSLNIEYELSDKTSDYVYSVESMVHLTGKKLSSKRNHINQFIRNYPDYEIVEISNEHLSECCRIMKEWCEARHCTCNSPEGCERHAFNQLADSWEYMPVNGILLKINDKFEGFTVGEKLNDTTVVIRYEKGNVDIHGIYAVLNRDYINRSWSEMKCVNREEDMGIEGLRRAKSSYIPSHMIRKFIVTIQEQ